MQLSITINGQSVTRECEPRTLLVHFIRDTPGLTGTHWGCDTSNCGACVVLMDGRPLKSCTALAVMCEGHEIRTVESLEVAGGLDLPLHGLQEHRRRGPLGGRARGVDATGGVSMSTVENLPSPTTERPIGFGRLKRKEDARFIRGKGTYLDDIRLPGMLHGAILRSPYAHARIVSVDTSAAEAHPKVKAVITGEILKTLN